MVFDVNVCCCLLLFVWIDCRTNKSVKRMTHSVLLPSVWSWNQKDDWFKQMLSAVICLKLNSDRWLAQSDEYWTSGHETSKGQREDLQLSLRGRLLKQVWRPEEQKLIQLHPRGRLLIHMSVACIRFSVFWKSQICNKSDPSVWECKRMGQPNE